MTLRIFSLLQNGLFCAKAFDKQWQNLLTFSGVGHLFGLALKVDALRLFVLAVLPHDVARHLWVGGDFLAVPAAGQRSKVQI